MRQAEIQHLHACNSVMITRKISTLKRMIFMSCWLYKMQLTAAECPMCKSATNIMVKAYCNGGILHKGASNYESWKCLSHLWSIVCASTTYTHANFTKCEGRPFCWTTHKRIMVHEYNILHFKHGSKWDSLNRLERRSKIQLWWNRNVHSIHKITLTTQVLQCFKHVCRNTCTRLQSNNLKSCL